MPTLRIKNWARRPSSLTGGIWSLWRQRATISRIPLMIQASYRTSSPKRGITQVTSTGLSSESQAKKSWDRWRQTSMSLSPLKTRRGIIVPSRNRLSQLTNLRRWRSPECSSSLAKSWTYTNWWSRYLTPEFEKKSGRMPWIGRRKRSSNGCLENTSSNRCAS